MGEKKSSCRVVSSNINITYLSFILHRLSALTMRQWSHLGEISVHTGMYRNSRIRKIEAEVSFNYEIWLNITLTTQPLHFTEIPWIWTSRARNICNIKNLFLFRLQRIIQKFYSGLPKLYLIIMDFVCRNISSFSFKAKDCSNILKATRFLWYFIIYFQKETVIGKTFQQLNVSP